MKSKLRIELDEQNLPVIELENIDSEDLRDKVARRFRESFGYWSNYCKIHYYYEKIIITPITPEEMYTLRDDLNERIKDYEKSKESLKNM